MKNQNGTKQKNDPLYPNYFYGHSLHNMMVKTTHMLMTDSHFGEPNKIKLKIIPTHHPQLYKIDWVFKIGKKKICTIHFEEKDGDYGKFDLCYLVWHDHSDVHYIDLYKRTFALPEKALTPEREIIFFRIE